MIVPVNIQILEFFVKKDKMSALRLYLYVKKTCNNHVHLSDIPHIKKNLNISKSVIRKNLKTLISLGIVEEFSPNYYRFHSWKKWCTGKNRFLDVDIEKLKDLKYLRTLYYFSKYRSSFFAAKKNRKLEKKQKFRLLPVAGIFVKMVTGIDRCVSTLSKQLKSMEVNNLITVKRGYKILAHNYSYEAVNQVSKYMDNCHILKRNKNLFSDYLLVKWMPNLISLNK